MIKLFCDLCGKEIINQDYVEQVIFNYFDFESSVEAHICRKCWESGSAQSFSLSNDKAFLNNNIKSKFKEARK